MGRRRTALVLAWLSLTVASSTFLGMSLRGGEGRRLFLPGTTTPGHHQIEERCELCHEAGEGVRQSACLGCHDRELAEADDSHSRQKFLDPRTAAMRDPIDGRACVSCHLEHRPAVTGAMGVSLPETLCEACHADVGRERSTHAGLPFTGCQATGCHNYHDNRALGAAFLAEHQGEPALRATPRVPALKDDRRQMGPPLAAAAHDAPPFAADPDAITGWAGSLHARRGVNCTGCHARAGGDGTTGWTERPEPDACRGCHADEVAGFLGGKHGMRLAVGLPAMRPADALLPMTQAAAHLAIGCSSCHGAHAVDRRHAAVDACLGCHADRHSLSYRGGPHHDAHVREGTDPAFAGRGVSCATCHLPRVRRVDTDRPGVVVEHDQNAALRPLETMVRTVCQPCHGIGFSLAALADPALIETSFDRPPTAEPPAFDMIRRQRASTTPEPETK